MANKTRNGITIDDGIVTVNGKKVGEVMQDRKHGYHPAVSIRIGKKVEWLELDTKNLIDVVYQTVNNMLEV